MFRRTLRACVAAVVLVLCLGGLASAAYVPVEPYADYVPQSVCAPRAKAGMTEVAGWMVRRYGGGAGAISRACHVGGTSEHKEGRAFDWSIDARRAVDRARATAFLQRIRATNGRGEHAALARRMGIMYVIWNDRIYAAHDRFRARPYLSASCPRLVGCSRTLRHRDHLHVSLSWRGARARTSWFVGRL